MSYTYRIQSCLFKNGIVRGITYQVKMLICTAWKMMTKKDANEWWLGTEVLKTWGFHDLVLKYNNVDKDGQISNQKCLYRFVQIKHMSCLTGGLKISISNLLSTNILYRQYSLLYLFKSYISMLDNFEMITADQIVDLMVFTNRDINAISFLVPLDKDEIFGFEGKGKRYRFDLDMLRNEAKFKVILDRLRGISSNETHLWNFLSKLVFMVDQPSEPELEKFIVEDMGKVFCNPQLFYNDLYKNIFEWFLVLENNTAPYLTKNCVTEHLKKFDDMLSAEKRTDTCFIAPILSFANLTVTN
ncbi:uncharacterized protein LOC114944697 [Nylanderia fulva]|uniref:uncharacterized protein LOC114944697 n=1 Tax=Nylanderia fulva TaxID=613905 RepID=UPI0010FB62DE|nr:uncharacterized protein LOC114944697 [Nylanderia fulva]XP_029176582.1 uncharacterized protein LOC114944697 [Nylanderia fulva]